jgi:hypothetical protein
MSTIMTLGQLMTATRQRADMLPTNYVPSTSSVATFVSDPELISYINQSYFELYDLLISAYGTDYFVAPPTSFQTDGQKILYPLPDGVLTFTNALTNTPFVPPAFYKLLGIDLVLSPGANPTSAGSTVTIKPFTFSERNRYATPNFQSFYGVTNLRYRLNGNNLWLTPISTAGQTIQLWFIPRLSTLTNISDTCDGISGWTEYIICDAALKCGQKEETDVSVLMNEKMALIKRLNDMANNRDAGMSATVGDTQGQDFWQGSSWNGWTGW